MSADSIERQKFAKFNEEQVLDNQDQSTTTQFKQSSNALSTTSAFTENNCKIKPIKTQRSLLTLTPQISQRRGSQSLADQTMRNDDGHFAQNHYDKNVSI